MWLIQIDLAVVQFPDSKVHGTNMGPIWGRQDPGGPHVGPMNFAICVEIQDLALWQSVVLNTIYSKHKSLWNILWKYKYSLLAVLVTEKL